MNEDIARMAAACTHCGECFKACPMVPYTDLAGADPERVTRDVIDLIQDKEVRGEGAAWAEACMMSGLCVDACPEPVNPRTMLAYARTKLRVKAGGVAGITVAKITIPKDQSEGTLEIVTTDKATVGEHTVTIQAGGTFNKINVTAKGEVKLKVEAAAAGS